MDKVFSKDRMLEEAALIDASVNFLVIQIDEQLRLFDKASQQDNQEELRKVVRVLKTLFAKLAKEDKNMDDFLVSYKKIETDEKKKMLSYIGQKEQEALRFISSNQGRAYSCQDLQGQVTGRR